MKYTTQDAQHDVAEALIKRVKATPNPYENFRAHNVNIHEWKKNSQNNVPINSNCICTNCKKDLKRPSNGHYYKMGFWCADCYTQDVKA